jgi:hypothetical protein
MSAHPNTMLILALTPDDLPMKTYRELCEEFKVKEGGEFKIGGEDYLHHGVMEDTFCNNYSLALPVGTIYLFDYVTYGYGEKITFVELFKQKESLAGWAMDVCEKFHCTFEIFVSANKW